MLEGVCANAPDRAREFDRSHPAAARKAGFSDGGGTLGDDDLVPWGAGERTASVRDGDAVVVPDHDEPWDDQRVDMVGQARLVRRQPIDHLAE